MTTAVVLICNHASTSVSLSVAFESMGMGLRGITRKWVGETGFTSRNAIHCKTNEPELSCTIKY